MSAPNVETVPVSGRNRCGLSLTVKSTGERCTLSELARRAGMSVQAMRHRWMDAGRPSVVDDAILAALPGKSGCAILVDYPPYGTVTFRRIQRIHKDLGKSLQFFRDRWRRDGRPEVVSAALFDHPDMRRIKGRTVPIPTDPKYLDDSLWSPDVPYADLCHLSGTENTGAGKGPARTKSGSSAPCMPRATWRRWRLSCATARTHRQHHAQAPPTCSTSRCAHCAAKGQARTSSPPSSARRAA